MTDLPIAGYASLFWRRDLNDDIVAKGAFSKSLAKSGANRVRMLHQHDTGGLIGAWDQVAEDDQGLFVAGRVFDFTPQGQLVQSLIRAGVLDGLSIGFRTKKARRDQSGRLRVLTEVELWEVSLVTSRRIRNRANGCLLPTFIAAIVRQHRRKAIPAAASL